MPGLSILVPLPAPVIFDGAALATRAATRIGGMSVSVHLPTAIEDEPALRRPGDLAWLADEPDYTDFGDPETDDRPESPWGYPASWSDGDRTYAVTQVAVVAATNADDASDALLAIRDGFATWFTLVRDAVEVFTKQDLDHVSPRRRMSMEGHGWEAWQDGERLSALGRLQFDFDYGRSLSAQSWERVLSHAAQGVRPVVEYLLLRDARNAHARSQFRRSVIDAATALEIGLYRLLLEEHRRTPTTLGGLYVESSARWTLGTLIGNVGRICALPSEVTTDLAGLRNSVVHKTAVEPTRDESALMLAATEAVLAMASPLPNAP